MFMILNKSETIFDKDDLPIGVNVLIFNNNNELLLSLRSQNIFGGGTWGLIGGKLKFGESFEETARRELFEEANLIVQVDDLLVINFANTVSSPKTHFLQIAVLVKKYSGELANNEPDKCDKLEFFAIDNLPGNLFPPTKSNINLFIKNQFYSQKENIFLNEK